MRHWSEMVADASEDYSGICKAIEISGITNASTVVAGLHTFLLRDRVGAYVPGFKGHLGEAKYLHDQYVRVSVGLKVFGVTKTSLRDLFIPVPPESEQSRIEEILTDSDSQIQALESLISKKRDIKQGTMQKLLSGKTRLPGFTGKWQNVELSQIGMVFSGSSAPQKKEYFSQGAYSFVRVSDLSPKNRDVELMSSRDSVNEKCVKECNLVFAKKGTIIFPKSGASVGNNNRAILGKDSYIVSHLAAIYSHTNCNDFIFHMLCMVDMMDYVGDPSYPSLSLSEIKKIEINIPKSVDEQRKISQILSDLSAEIVALEQRLEKAKAIKQGMMQQLLTGRIRLVDPSTPVEASA
jgi:type I restriction enzyme S subunit